MSETKEPFTGPFQCAGTLSGFSPNVILDSTGAFYIGCIDEFNAQQLCDRLNNAPAPDVRLSDAERKLLKDAAEYLRGNTPYKGNSDDLDKQSASYRTAELLDRITGAQAMTPEKLYLEQAGTMSCGNCGELPSAHNNVGACPGQAFSLVGATPEPGFAEAAAEEIVSAITACVEPATHSSAVSRVAAILRTHATSAPGWSAPIAAAELLNAVLDEAADVGRHMTFEDALLEARTRLVNIRILIQGRP